MLKSQIWVCPGRSKVQENRIITIPGLKGRDPKEISEKNLSRIIQARVEEILDYVVWEIKRSGLERKLIGGIVLTGGGALLKHIDKLAEFHTGMSTRIGLPIEQLGHGNYDERVCNPIYATAIGLLLKGIENPHCIDLSEEEKVEEEPEASVEEETSNKWYEQLFHKTKEWFETEPDSEF